MALRPKIRNADGTLTDIPLEAAQAVKLKTARSIGISGLDAESASFNGTSAVKIKVTGVPASLLTGTASIDTTGNAATATRAYNADEALYAVNASKAEKLSSSWTEISPSSTNITHGTYLFLVVIDDNTSGIGGHNASFTEIITANSMVFNGLNRTSRYHNDYQVGSIHIYSANNYESPWFRTARLKFTSMTSTQFKIDLFVCDIGGYATSSSSIIGKQFYPNTLASTMSGLTYSIYYKRII